MSEKIEVGCIVDGKVVKTKPFGAIVTLPGGVQGLVHISHISTSFVQNIADYVKVGQLVKVKVISIDAESGKISLSMKEASEPTETTVKKQPQNDMRAAPNVNSSFEDKFKEWLKVSNERQAGLNKRNKRR